MPSLEVLDLSNNRLDGATLAFFIDNLPLGSKLRILELGANCIWPESSLDIKAAAARLQIRGRERQRERHDHHCTSILPHFDTYICALGNERKFRPTPSKIYQDKAAV